MAKIEAPFTPEQVEKLKQWQSGEREDEGVLIPTTEGWVCPCGEWKQNWCHDFMVE